MGRKVLSSQLAPRKVDQTGWERLGEVLNPSLTLYISRLTVVYAIFGERLGRLKGVKMVDPCSPSTQCWLSSEGSARTKSAFPKGCDVTLHPAHGVSPSLEWETAECIEAAGS